MLRSIKQLYGNQLGATDGEIGHVKDFYFEDQTWTIRYVIVDTGAWLPGRKVLISPYSLGRLDQAEKILRVNLTRKQIEDSPSIEPHKQVLRQYEEEYYRYYGWPRYWQGGGLWGASGLPLVEIPIDTAPNDPPVERADTKLRSTQAITGYQVQTAEGMMGHICDFMMDAQSWAIGQLVVKTGNRFTGKEELIPVKEVTSIRHEESTVYLDLAREVIPQNPDPQLVTAETSH